MYKLSPSKAHRFLNCTASLLHDVPFVETPATIRGNMLHSFAEMFFSDATETEIEDFIQKNQINEYEYTLINKYVETIINEYNSIGAYKIIIEQKKAINMYGFSNNSIIDTLVLAKNEATVIDLKTGNIDVDIIDNEQLYYYGYGVIDEYPTIPIVHLVIFQKMRAKKITKTKGEILDFFLEKAPVFDDIRNNNLKYNPSDKACRFCPIKKTCIARAQWIVGGKK